MIKRERRVDNRIRKITKQCCSYRIYVPLIWIKMIQREHGEDIKAVKIEIMPDKSLRITPFITSKRKK